MTTGGVTKTLSARGAEISYDIRAARAPNVVFIHGWACRKDYWEAMIDALGAPGTFVAIDLPAHGASTPGSGPWTMERFGQDVVDVIDAEGLTDVVLAGHSMGAAVALEAAKLARRNVRSVVAVDALSHLGTYRAQPEAAVTQTLDFMRADLPGGVAAMMGPIFSSDPKDGVKERVIAEMGSIDPEHGLAALQSLLAWDMDAVLAETDVPVTILAARNIMPEGAVEALGARCDVRALDLEGHFFCIEQPKETAEELRAVIGG